MFNQAFADYAIGFIECLKHTDGQWAGKPFNLLPWQKEAVSQFYGNIRGDTSREFQYLYLEIPKKNGKSELAAALGLFHTFADEEIKGEVYVCAADKENASIVFNVALEMLKMCPTLKKRAKIKESTKEIVDRMTGTKMKVMSSDAFSKHGYKPSCVIFDELHAQKNRDLWDVMTFGAGSARFQPVWIVLTTAGDDPDRNSIGWEIHQKAKSIINYRKGLIEDNYDDPVWLPYMFGLTDDPNEVEKIDIYDEAIWYQCNPSLGLTLKIETLRQEALDARESKARERLFRWLRLNQWISLKTVGWLPITLFDETIGEEIDLRGKRCYGGLDLSSTTDLTAFVLLFPPQDGLDRWYVKFNAYITEDKMKDREERDKVPFRQWVEQGFVKTTPGDTIDFDFVQADILSASKEYKLTALGTDPYLSRMMTQSLMKEKLNVIEIPQNMTTLSPAMKDVERKLLEKNMAHEKNPCARWCFGNTRCAIDGNENIKPMKNKSTSRIDITVAWIIAMATAMLDDTVDKKTIISSDHWGL